jgi:hypothetical protein
MSAAMSDYSVAQAAGRSRSPVRLVPVNVLTSNRARDKLRAQFREHNVSEFF